MIERYIKFATRRESSQSQLRNFENVAAAAICDICYTVTHQKAIDRQFRKVDGYVSSSLARMLGQISVKKADMAALKSQVLSDYCIDV